MTKQIARAIQTLITRFQRIFSVGTILKAKHRSCKVALAYGGVHESMPLIQHYGFKSRPPLQTACLVASAGDRHSSAIIGSDNQDGPKLKEGSTALYSGNTSIVLDRDTVRIRTKKIAIEGQSAELLRLVSELCDALAQAQVPTCNGPKPLSTVAQITAIKGKWDAYIDR